MIHKCSKEVDIELIKQHQIVTDEKLEEIKTTLNQVHSKLVGNGKPGICDELAEMRGEKRTIIFITGLVCTAITILVTIVLKFIKI